MKKVVAILVTAGLAVGGVAFGVNAMGNDDNKSVTIQPKSEVLITPAQTSSQLDSSTIKPTAHSQQANSSNATGNKEQATTNNSHAKQGIKINREQAAQTALQQVNGTHVKEIDLDKENGVPTYEVEVQTKQGEKEIAVNALTGKAYVKDHNENDDYDDDKDNDYDYDDKDDE
jgi:uncharacterized membrane protein YkoI